MLRLLGLLPSSPAASDASESATTTAADSSLDDNSGMNGSSNSNSNSISNSSASDLLESTGYTSETVEHFKSTIREREQQLRDMEDFFTTRILLLQKERDEALMGTGVGVDVTQLHPDAVAAAKNAEAAEEQQQQLQNGQQQQEEESQSQLLPQEQIDYYEQQIESMSQQMQQMQLMMQEQQQQHQQQYTQQPPNEASNASTSVQSIISSTSSINYSNCTFSTTYDTLTCAPNDPQEVSTLLLAARREVETLYEQQEQLQHEKDALEKHLTALITSKQDAAGNAAVSAEANTSEWNDELVDASSTTDMPNPESEVVSIVPGSDAVTVDPSSTSAAHADVSTELQRVRVELESEVARRTHAEAYIAQTQESTQQWQMHVEQLQQQLQQQQQLNESLQQQLVASQSSVAPTDSVAPPVASADSVSQEIESIRSTYQAQVQQLEDQLAQSNNAVVDARSQANTNYQQFVAAQQQLEGSHQQLNQVKDELSHSRSECASKDAALHRLQEELLAANSFHHHPVQNGNSVAPSPASTAASLQQQVQQLQYQLSQSVEAAFQEKERTQQMLNEKLTKVKTVIASKDQAISKMKVLILDLNNKLIAYQQQEQGLVAQ